MKGNPLVRAASRTVSWAPALVWAAVLFTLSSAPDLPGGGLLDPIPAGDKLVHFALYAVLGGCLAWGGRRQAGGAPLPSWVHVVLVLAGALYGASDEWHQSWVPGRDASVLDWVADLCGVTWGYWLGCVRWAHPPRTPQTATPEIG